MSASSLEGQITIEPPLDWREVKGSKFGRTDSNHSLIILVDEREEDDDQGTRITRRGIAIKSQWEDQMKHYYVSDELERIVAEFPDREFTGELVRIGESAVDIERYLVRDGRVISEAAVVTATWPDGTPAPLPD